MPVALVGTFAAGSLLKNMPTFQAYTGLLSRFAINCAMEWPQSHAGSQPGVARFQGDWRIRGKLRIGKQVHVQGGDIGINAGSLPRSESDR